MSPNHAGGFAPRALVFARRAKRSERAGPVGSAGEWPGRCRFVERPVQIRDELLRRSQELKFTRFASTRSPVRSRLTSASRKCLQLPRPLTGPGLRRGLMRRRRSA